MEFGEPLNLAPIAVTAFVFVVSWLMVEVEGLEKKYKQEEAETLLLTDAEEQEQPKPKKIPVDHPLDEQITQILSESTKPMTAREILKQIAATEKSQINSRLYTLLSKRKIQQTKTKGAPQWFM
jgi:predicted HTH transcriptional regulator